MAHAPHLPALDAPPSTGTWIEHDDFDLTDDDAASGNALGAAIDVRDDTDAGIDW